MEGPTSVRNQFKDEQGHDKNILPQQQHGATTMTSPKRRSRMPSYAGVLVVVILLAFYNVSTSVTISHDHQSTSNLPDSAIEQQQQQQQHDLITDDCCSACLLVMDDNHYLIEWLAYHWQLLPLRRLIVAVDPQSVTSPRSILERWNQSNLMHVTLWNDDDYLLRVQPTAINNNNNNDSLIIAKPVPRRRKSNNDPQPNNITNAIRKTNPSYLLQLHRFRQRKFMAECMRTLKQEGRTWTAFLDTDEYITVNPFASILHRFWHIWQGTTTIASLFSRQSKLPCIIIPRLLIGPTKSATQQQVETFNTSQFLTFSYTHSGSRKANSGPGKGFVDVSRVSADLFSTKQTNPHRPIYDICPAEDMWTPNKHSPFIIHHYIGTYDQWSFRDDPRKYHNSTGTRSWEKYQQYLTDLNQHTDNSIHHDVLSSNWLVDFVDSVGLKVAQQLLQDVGQVTTG